MNLGNFPVGQVLTTIGGQGVSVPHLMLPWGNTRLAGLAACHRRGGGWVRLRDQGGKVSGWPHAREFGPHGCLWGGVAWE